MHVGDEDAALPCPAHLIPGDDHLAVDWRERATEAGTELARLRTDQSAGVRCLCNRVYVGPGECSFLDRALAENDEIRRRIGEIIDYQIGDIGKHHGRITLRGVKLLSALADDHACTCEGCKP